MTYQDKVVDKKERPKYFKKGSIFNMNFEDFSSEEIYKNAINLRFIALEYLNKFLVLLQNFNRNNMNAIKIDIGEIFFNLIENNTNLKIFKKMNKIIQDHGFSHSFYKSQQDYTNIDFELQLKINENQNIFETSFDKISQNLSEILIDENNDDQMKNMESTIYADEKEELEILFFTGNLSITKNEKLTKYFIKDLENLHTLQSFLAIPFNLPLSSKLNELTSEIEFNLFPTLKLGHIGQVLDKQDSLCETDQLNTNLIYLRAFLTLQFHDEKENFDSLINLNQNYLEHLFEKIYDGLKDQKSFLTLIIFLLQTLLEKNIAKTVSLILKYNFVFLFLEQLKDPKCFDFLLNFISPNSRVNDINPNLQIKIWEYLKQAGFFKDIVNGIIEPSSFNQNLKFDKFFTNSEIQSIIDQIYFNENQEFSSTNNYNRIRNTFYLPSSQFDSFLCTDVYNVSNFIDLTQSEINKLIEIENQKKEETNAMNTLKKINTIVDPVKGVFKMKFKYLFKLISSLIEQSNQQTQKQQAIQSTEQQKENTLKSIKKGLTQKQSTGTMRIQKKNSKQTLLTKSNSKQSFKNQSPRNPQRGKPEQQEMKVDPDKFVFLPSKKEFVDGYLGSNLTVNIYPSIVQGNPDSSNTINKENEIILKNLTKSQFQKNEYETLKVIKFISYLFDDIISVTNVSKLEKSKVSRIDPQLLIDCLLNFEQSNLFLDLLQNFIYKIQFIFEKENKIETSPYQSALLLLKIINFVSSCEIGRGFKPKIKIHIKEYYGLIQQRFHECYVYYNEQKIKNDKKYEIKKGQFLRDPIGNLRVIFVEIIFTIVQLEIKESDLFEIIDTKVLQIIFIWILEKKHNFHLASQFLRFIEYLYEQKAEKFLLEITLKLDIFGIINDIINAIFINDILVSKELHGESLLFINRLMKIYSKIGLSAAFPLLNDCLKKINNFRLIMESMQKIYQDSDFVIQQRLESVSQLSQVSKDFRSSSQQLVHQKSGQKKLRKNINQNS